MRRTRSFVLVAALGLTLPAGVHAQVPATPPSAPSDQERIDLEQQTKLDLSKSWRAYRSARKGESFYQFVEKDLRRKRDIGRGLTAGGLGGLVVGVALFTIGIPQPDQPIPLTISSYAIIGLSGASTIVGSIVWGIFFKKMEKLEVAEDRGLALGPRGRVRLLSVTPTGFALKF